MRCDKAKTFKTLKQMCRGCLHVEMDVAVGKHMKSTLLARVHHALCQIKHALSFQSGGAAPKFQHRSHNALKPHDRCAGNNVLNNP